MKSLVRSSQICRASGSFLKVAEEWLGFSLRGLPMIEKGLIVKLVLKARRLKGYQG